MGSAVDERSDLYSFGAMLYEMVTGKQPFLGDDPVGIISQHINTPPVSPAWHNALCPRPLDALILRLLAKDPAQRPGSASDVLAALTDVDLRAVEERTQEEARSLDSLAGGVFVGRQREMAVLKSALDDSISGRGRLVMLAGEPGIGKTTAAAELTTYAGLRGAEVLWGRCYEERGMPPYWPWVQAIRSYVSDKTPDELREDMGAGAADIADLVAEVKEKLPDLIPAPALDNPDSERFRLFDSITSFLANAGKRRPLTVVLDDLHWADGPSLQLLQFVSKEFERARLMVLGTYRDIELSRRHPLAETLGELTRSPSGGFQRVLLRGMTLQDVGEFIDRSSGMAPPTGLPEVVHAQTEGNALFVTEVVRLLVQEGELSQELDTSWSESERTWDVRIPEGVHEVIGRRLNQLSEHCNSVIAVAAVLGREFEATHLRLLIEDTTEDELLNALEEALAARVIEELPQAVGSYRFTHALIRKTLTDEISTTRRVRLHARIGETLESLYGGEVEAHAAQLAYHFGEAETVIGPAKLLRYSQAAGIRALNGYASEEAAAQFQRALAAKEGQPMDSESAAILLGLGQAEAMMLKIDEAVSHLRQAFDFYVEAGDATRAVTAAGVPMTGRAFGIMATLIEQALHLIPADSMEAGRLLSVYGRYLGMSAGDYEGAQQAFERALAIAERENDLLLKIRTLTNASNVDSFHLHHQESLGKSLSAIELAGVVDSPRDESMAHIIALSGRLQNRDLARAKRHGEACRAAAERLRDRERLSTACSAYQSAVQAEGDWEAARALSNRALASWPYDPRTLGGRVLLECQTGNFDESQSYLDRLLETSDASPADSLHGDGNAARVIPMVCHIAGVTDRLDIAREAADTVLSSPYAVPVWVVSARTGLALTAFLEDDATAAAQQYSALESQRGTVLTSVAALCGEIGIDRVLGLLSHTMGNMDGAAVHFEESLEFCREAGFSPELAWTCHDYADMLIRRGASGDLSKTGELLDEADRIGSDLGMTPLVEELRSLREQFDNAPPEYPDGLTNREVEVLRLIAAGKNNREIGEELFITHNTVARHVSNIFVKTGATNRAEAAVYATRNGLAT